MSVLGTKREDASPCVSKCSHSVGDDICRGCGRTVQEVLDWNRFTSKEKIEVKKVCRERLGSL